MNSREERDEVNIYEDDEEGREVILQWRRKRLDFNKKRKQLEGFHVHTLTIDTVWSFCQNINYVVVIQMLVAATSVYVFQKFGIAFEIPVALCTSPIVFPLAFLINTDFKRREKLLEGLASFKSSTLVWFFCMREWREVAGLSMEWTNTVQGKLNSLLYNLREYLFTQNGRIRKIILFKMYEDLSDLNQLNEKLRIRYVSTISLLSKV